MKTKEKTLIFEPYTLNGLTLSNRIVMAPMTRSRADNQAHTALSLLLYIIASVLLRGLLLPRVHLSVRMLLVL